MYNLLKINLYIKNVFHSFLYMISTLITYEANILYY